MRPGPVARGTSASRPYRAATRLATAWLRLYTAGAAPSAAAERRMDVDLELWEHALAADARWSAARATASLLLQTAAGVPGDLSWRHAVRSPETASEAPPLHLLVRRHRQRFWVPLRNGHVFDQTNGMTGPQE